MYHIIMIESRSVASQADEQTALAWVVDWNLHVVCMPCKVLRKNGVNV